MAKENLGSLVAQMIALAVKNPEVVDPKYNGNGAVAYNRLVAQLNEIQEYFLVVEKKAAKLAEEELNEELKRAFANRVIIKPLIKEEGNYDDNDKLRPIIEGKGYYK